MICHPRAQLGHFLHAPRRRFTHTCDMVGSIQMALMRGGLFRRLTTAALVAVLLLGVSLDGLAANDAHWRIDPVQSDIHFQLSAIGIVPIRGSFETFSGEIWRDPGDGQWRVGMRIDAGSLSMASDRYRDWARSKEFFDVGRHPRIEFQSGPLSPLLLAEGGELNGTLRLRGIERVVAFHVQSSRCSAASDRCELHVLGDINRRQFGMISRRLTLSDRVTLDMRFVAVALPPATTTAPATRVDQSGPE